MFDPGVAVFNPNDDANNDVSQPVVLSSSSCTKDFIEIESSGETCSRLDRLLLILDHFFQIEKSLKSNKDAF